MTGTTDDEPEPSDPIAEAVKAGLIGERYARDIREMARMTGLKPSDFVGEDYADMSPAARERVSALLDFLLEREA